MIQFLPTNLSKSGPKTQDNKQIFTIYWYFTQLLHIKLKKVDRDHSLEEPHLSRLLVCDNNQCCIPKTTVMYQQSFTICWCIM